MCGPSIPFVLLLLIPYSTATVFSNSLQRCEDHCVDRNLNYRIKIPSPESSVTRVATLFVHGVVFRIGKAIRELF
uniref:Secreted protein n=1 Tax=Steinernema glaseri TaxID=37863 RepID=A0A1I7ZS30_9BILA